LIACLASISARAQEVLPTPQPFQGTPGSLGLDDLIRIGLENNPALKQAGIGIDAARGSAVQAGLYPNPTVTFSGEEIGSQGGIHTLPFVSQEIVTANKLGLSRAAALREVDQAQFGLMNQRLILFSTVRKGFFEVLTNQQRLEVLDELVKLADQSYKNALKLLQAKQVAELDVLPFEVELGQLQAQREAAVREVVASWRKLAAAIGTPHLPYPRLLGDLKTNLPVFDFTKASAVMLGFHPNIQSAQAGIAKADLTLRRAEVEVVPNVTVGAGYSKNFNDNAHQATYQVSIPIPVWNRNQGNIFKAKAELAKAIQEVNRVANDLSRQLADAFGRYAAARKKAEYYQTVILPKAERSFELAFKAYKGGQFEYLRVIQAQQVLGQARLQYVQNLGEAWQAASELSGLLPEDQWSLACPK
jgi:cobalt-zinc-cadmium efflux system outer membrane protein